jgi:hypothetical protein
MAEHQIHLTVTPQQARTLAAALKLTKEFFAVAANTAVYPNLGDFSLERDLVKAEINTTEKAVLEQLEGQMPTE